MEHSKLNKYLAAFVFVFVWIVYFITKAPTLSFWDCGEFVACSYSLGIPHPPGTPLFVLLGKVVSMLLFFVKERAVRITLISTTGGALTAMVVYLMAIRFLILGFGRPERFWKRFALYAGGVVSGLCTAFASTVWFNNVEAEVYGANIGLMVFTNWLILRWAERRTESDSDRYIILIIFIAFLNIGLHVQSLLVMPSFFLYVILLDKEKMSDWRFWVIGAVLFLQAIAVSQFLWLAPAALVVTFLMMIFSTHPQKKKWQLVFWMSFVALLGYSVHLYIPIRSAQNPIIDENNPETMQQFRYFLERKQYGSESMMKQAFTRKGTFRGQLWDGKNMGYGLYHVKQFHRDLPIYHERSKGNYWTAFDLAKPKDLGRLLLYLLPTIVMLYGMYAMYQRNRESSLMFISLYVVTALGIVFYMNFKDGSNPEFPREVRERDYFFAAGFVYYMFWVGIGVSALMRWLLDHPKEIMQCIVGPAACCLLALTPAVPLGLNYQSHNRTGNYVPWDYSYNLLMSCEKDGILFTNGDNDTFPVWALQEVYGVRKDVRIVNLSLLNTGWYIEQLKQLDPKVPISFSLNKIHVLNHERNPFKKGTKYEVGKTGLVVELPDSESKPVLRIQDKMVLNIVAATNWQKPVYFAVTVSDDNRMGLDPYLSMEGLVFKLVRKKINGRMDVDMAVNNLLQVYKYRGLGDGSCYMDDDTRKLLTNYTAAFIGVALAERRPMDSMRDKVKSARQEAEALAAKGVAEAESKKMEAVALEEAYKKRLDRVVGVLTKATKLIPDDWRPRVLLTEFLMNHGRFDQAEIAAKEGAEIEPTRNEYWYQLAMAQEKAGKYQVAIQTNRKIVQMNPDYYRGYASMAEMYQKLGQKNDAVSAYNEWLKRHPGDRRAKQAIEAIQKDTAMQETTKVG